ncbi:hypothetical protein HYW54_01830 [Candidatus Gottesmanbacteria bacterium]|nr:hypothetical protein [Candidatus Gottesmanbacteria bacterium]
MKRFVIIDGNAILHRAFHALPPLTTKNGELINAVYGFTSMLLRVIDDLRPTYLAITFDRPKPTFRQTLYAGYQAHRPKMDEGLSSQIERVHEVVKTMGIPVFEVDGFEADDVIGTLTGKIKDLPAGRQVKSEKIEAVVVTGDRDILQLVDRETKVCMPVKGLIETKIYGEKEVEEKFGIMPSQMVDYKSLVGDQSDGYPGVSGIGPKTAVNLLSRFRSLEETYAHVGEIENEKLRNTLAENSDQAMLAKKLAEIVRDVPLSFRLEECKLPQLDSPEINKLFKELGFKSLIPRLSFANSSSADEEEKYKEEILANLEVKKSILANLEVKKSKKKKDDKQIKLF